MVKPTKDISNIRYFNQATTWADDINLGVVMSRNRYRMAFLGMGLLCGLLALAILCLMPLKSVQLVVVHDKEEGGCLVSTLVPGEQYTPSWAQAKSEIARYVQYREGYDPNFYSDYAYRLQLMSSPALVDDYMRFQRRSNPKSPVYQLGVRGVKKVFVQNILKLDDDFVTASNEKIPINKAQITFTVDTEFLDMETVQQDTYVALISWKYRAPPKNISDQLINWSGFQVIQYQRTQLSISK